MTNMNNSSTGATNELKLCQLEKTYPNGVKALDNISLTLTNGMFGLLGHNGAGKSSLMKSLATLQALDKGNIYFNGVDIGQNPEAMRNSLGYLPQEFGVYPKMSAIKLLNYLATLKGIHNKSKRQAQINQLLELTNLDKHRHHYVADFSGGMRQRFGIAQALLGSPKVLIIDEPTAGLDPMERNSLHNLLCHIAEKMIVILSTHIVEDINNLCAKMAVMNKGKICFVGSPQQLTEQLNNRLWQKSVDKHELTELAAKQPILSTRLLAGSYQVRIVSQTQPAQGFDCAKPDLEDAYFYTLNQSVQKSQQVQQPAGAIQ